MLLGRFGCHLGGQWGPEGVPKASFWGPDRHKEAPKWCSGGVSRKRSKNERKQGPKMSDFWEAGTSKIVLPCRRRAYFAKTGRCGKCHEKKIKNESPNGSQNGPKIGPRGVLG